jgi:signal transduction histidine kinase
VSPAPSSRHHARFQLAARAAGWFAASVGLLVCIGWVFDVGWLRSFHPDWPPATLWAGISFIAAGAALAHASAPEGARKNRGLVLAAGLLVVAIGGAGLLEAALGHDLLGSLVPTNDADAPGVIHPGRLSPNAALGLTLTGLAVTLGLGAGRQRVAQGLALGTGAVALVSLTGYLYGVPVFTSGLPGHNAMGVATALCLVVLGAGIVLAKPEVGLARIAAADTTAGLLMRRIIPAALLLPLVLGWARLFGERAGYYSTEEGVLLNALASVAAFALIVAWTAAVSARAEAARRAAQRAHVESEERLSLALRAAELGIWSWNPSKDRLRWDDGTRTSHGFPAGVLEGTLPAFLAHVKEEDRPRVQAALHELANGDGTFDLDYRTTADRLLRSRGGSHRGDDGHVRVLGVVWDVTERHMAEQVAKHAAELERSNKDLEMFAYAASHDLKEPLRMVSSFVMLLQRRYQGKLDAKADEYIRFAVEGATRMQQLVDGLLEYARVGTRTRPAEPVKLDEVVSQVRTDLAPLLADSGAEFVADPLPEVFGDRVQIARLLQNLVVNGIKFRGSQAPRVHVSAATSGDYCTVSVRDNGIGIDPEYQDQLFVLFRRLHTRNEYDGIGVGLAVCKRIVERHGGRIWLESKPGDGTTFHFTLPRTNGEK